MNEIRKMIKGYEKMFKSIKSENDFDNLNIRFELEKIEYEYFPVTSKYFINETINNDIYIQYHLEK